MKALVLAAALAALSSTALAGAARDARPQALTDTTTTTLMADAGRLGSASLTALNGSHWTPAQQQAEIDGGFEALTPDFDTGALLVGLGVVAFILSRPLARALRRQEQQRRAAALASTLGSIQRD
jgi:flagellar biosynthesis/type III secretory pathway M-ring protein FliF/YscJ